MKTCKMCKETMTLEEFEAAGDICDCCFSDDFESLDLEDKIEVLLA